MYTYSYMYYKITYRVGTDCFIAIAIIAVYTVGTYSYVILYTTLSPASGKKYNMFTAC